MPKPYTALPENDVTPGPGWRNASAGSLLALLHLVSALAGTQLLL